MSQEKKMRGPRIPKDNLDYVELWKFFEERGSEVKSTMFNVVTWILGFAFVLTGIIIKEFFQFNQNTISISEPLALIIFSIVGLAIVYYSDLVIRDFGGHINRNFDRADAAREGDKSVDEIWAKGVENSTGRNGLPKICKTIRKVSLGFLSVFIIFIIVGLCKIIK